MQTAPGIYTPTQYREIIDRYGMVVSYTQGVSMLPLIKSGRNYVSVVKIDGEPAINDIVLFEEVRGGETKAILHRLIEIREDKDGERIYITRGDNCIGCERMRRDAILGKVYEIYTQGKDKVVRMDDPSYLRYVRLWNATFPLRKLALSIRWRLARIPLLRKIYHKIKRQK